MTAPEEPLIVIAAVPQKMEGKVQKRIGDLVAMWKSRTAGTGRAQSTASKARLGKGLKVKKERKEREVVFAWMNADKWSDWIKSMYAIEYDDEGATSLADVHVVITDHKVCVVLDFGSFFLTRVMQRLIYWNRDSQGNPIRLSKRLLDVVQDVVDGKLDYQHSENTIERLARVCRVFFYHLVICINSNESCRR